MKSMPTTTASNRSPRWTAESSSKMLFASSIVVVAVLLLLLSPLTTTPTFETTQQQIKQLKPRSILLFSQSPHEFTSKVTDCIASSTCHILYHHVQKTGGSNVASRLYPVMESNTNRTTYESKDWCCNQKLVDRFQNDTQDYCLHKKLGIYEVTGTQFGAIADTCRTDNPSHTYVSLISIREPIQRTLSMIHHQCNKNFDKKNATEQAVCSRCQYSKRDAWFWDQFTNQTNAHSLELMQTIQTAAATVAALQSSSSSSSHDGQQNNGVNNNLLLLLDTVMIDSFFELLSEDLDIKIANGRGNKEKTHICNFGMTSSIIKDLYVSQMIYRGLLAGYNMG